MAPRLNDARRLAHADEPLHPVEQRAVAALLRLDVDRLVAVDRIRDRAAGRAARGRRVEKPAFQPPFHCMGVRTPLRSPR